MPVRVALLASRRLIYRLGLLAGVSAVAVAAACLPARAGGPIGVWSPSTAPNIAAATSAAASQQAATLAQQSQASLTATTNAIRSILNAQAAARAAAQAAPSSVPNGLAPSGLVVDPRVTSGSDANLWINASQPVQATSNGQTTVTVTQTAKNAIATWQSFNIGANTTLNFDQSGGGPAGANGWVILNRIDYTGLPSQILGQIKAQGTVLVINPNGIVFNGTSQINVGTLIASSLDVNLYGPGSTGVGAYAAGQPAYVQPGSYSFFAPSNEDGVNRAFVSNGLYPSGAANFLIGAQTQACQSANCGAIIVAPGASIDAATNSTSGAGGYVALLGAAVSNAGSITTSGGQVILAASYDVGITLPQPGATGVNTAISVAAGAYSPYSSQAVYLATNSVLGLAERGLVSNSGLLTANDGNVTLAGYQVTQSGGIAVSTSTTQPGSVTINAVGGNVDLLPGSILAILPDESGPAVTAGTLASAAATLQPQITISASAAVQQVGYSTQPVPGTGNIVFWGSTSTEPGALIKAPSAAVTLSADYLGLANHSTVLLDGGSTIDLSGLAGVSVPASQNLITLKISPAEVADDPLARSLIGQTVTIDARLNGVNANGLAWIGSPILDAAGYANTVNETIDQALTAGGKLTVTSEGGPSTPATGYGNFVQKPGAVINLSGGFVNYGAGQVNTTKLVGSDGRIYDIGSVNLNLGYVGVAGQYVASHPHWGTSETYVSSLLAGGYYDPGYISGANAGALTASAAVPILAGTILAETVIGPRQAAGLQALPQDAALALTLTGNSTIYPVVLESFAAAGANPLNLAGLTPQTLTSWAPVLGAGNSLPVFTDILSSAGFGSISIAGGGTTSLAAGATLSVQPGPGGSASKTGITLNNVTEIDGTINAPGGNIVLNGFNFTQNNALQANGGAVHDLVLGPQAVLNVAGLFVNDTGVYGDGLQGASFINGGSVSIKTPAASQETATQITSGSVSGSNVTGDYLLTVTDLTQGIVLSSGSLIDVSSGGYVGPSGQIKYGADGLPAGKGGSLTLQTYVGGFADINTSNIPGSQTIIQTGAVSSPLTLQGGGTVAQGSSIFYYSTANSNCFGGICISGLNVAPTTGLRANIAFGGTIEAAGFDGGGTLSLEAPSIRIIAGTGPVTSYFSALPASVNSALATPGVDNLGTSAAQVAVSAARQGEIDLPASFFNGNEFGNYVLTAAYGDVTVAANASVTLRQSSLQPTSLAGQAAETAQPSGESARNFASLGLAQDGLRLPVNLTLFDPNQGPYYAPDFGTSGVLVDTGASILADTGASAPSTINLVANGGPVTVLGTVSAPSGIINIYTNSAAFNATTGLPTPSGVWIGSTAVLDVSSLFVANPHPAGYITPYLTGSLLSAGTITLDSGGTGLAVPGVSANLAAAEGTLVVAPGAELLLKGGAMTIQAPVVSSSSLAPLAPRLADEAVWSNGGTLQIAGGNLFFAVSVDAAGGAPLAAGGNLTIGGQGNFNIPSALASILGSGFVLPSAPVAVVIEPAGSIAASLAQSGLSPANFATFPLAYRGDYLGVDTLSNSGFGSASIYAATIAFAGSFNDRANGAIKIPGALTLSAGSFTLLPASGGLLPAGITNASNLGSYKPAANSIGGTSVTIEAGYVDLIGQYIANVGQINAQNPTFADGRLDIAAQWIDLQGSIGINNAANVDLTSTGAIRLLPALYGTSFQNSVLTSFPGALYAPGNLTLTAAEVFPATQTEFLLESTGTTAGFDTLTINGNGPATAPLSAGGILVLNAVNIAQDGTLWAPLGNIVIGVNSATPVPAGLSGLFGSITTANVNLGAGSLTSVSAAGLDIPYGYTTNSTTWYLGPSNSTGAPPFGGNAVPLANPPVKSVGLYGANIATAPGAVIDASGGGDIYATEFVAGNGGSVNVLATYNVNLSQSSTTVTAYQAQYPDGRQVYALVPAYEAKVAAFDPTFYGYPYYSGVSANPGDNLSNIRAQAARNGQLADLATIATAPGTAITIAGGNGIAAGTYVLLPGMYATLPGAYRVVQVASNLNPTASVNIAAPDGSLYVSGNYSNLITGARSSQTALFEIQPKATWSQYSDIVITSGTSFFTGQAVTAGTIVPPLPTDGGVLAIGATSTLSLQGTNRFAGGTSDLLPGLTGAGGQVQISASNIFITDGSVAAPTGALVLEAAQIDNLGASSVLIGGTAAANATGILITPSAQTLEVHTSAATPLTGPDLILVTKSGGQGLTVDSGSVISAVGTVGDGVSQNITIGVTGGANGDSALLAVSNGAPVSVTQLNLPSSPLARFTISPGAMISGNTVTLISSGYGSIGSGATVTAQNYDFGGSVINIGGGSNGLVLTAANLASFAGGNVQLHSTSTIDFYDAAGLTIGTAADPLRSLTLDAAALYDQSGGTTTIYAGNVTLGNFESRSNPGNPFGGAANGTFAVDASGTITLGGPATAATLALNGFGAVTFDAGQAIAFTGSGKLDAGAAAVTLTAPLVTVGIGAAQALTTTGTLTLLGAGAGVPVFSASNSGCGSLTLTAASITDSGVIEAPLSGAVTLAATTGGVLLDGGVILTPSGRVTVTAPGDIVLSNGAQILAPGFGVPVLDQTAYEPGGVVQLASSAGNVTLAGSTIDVAAAINGYAGTVVLTASGTVTLSAQNDLVAGAAYNDVGGQLLLSANAFVGPLPIYSGFTRAFAVSLQQGNIDIAQGDTLTSQNVSLTANGGSVTVEGTIDASGTSGGTISLYGNGGVAIGGTARLIAASHVVTDPNDPGFSNGSAQLVQTGGVITLGTIGMPTGGYNADGSEQVTSSGAITVAAGALLDISGGSGATDIITVNQTSAQATNGDGAIIIRTPLLADGTANVHFAGTVKSNNGNGSVALDAYETWSTTDNTTGGQHFDGIIDPAGFFDKNGKQLIFADAAGLYPSSSAANPASGAYLPHVEFYQTTLLGFVQNFAVTADFSGAQFVTGGGASVALPSSQLHLRPEIDLVNPSSSINKGNITVASNWNLGAGTESASGAVTLLYRTAAGEPGALSLRAVNNVNFNATISDGFFQQYNPNATLPTLIPITLSATDFYNQELANLNNPNFLNFNSYGSYFSGGSYGVGDFIFYDNQFNSLTQSQVFSAYTSIPANLLGPVLLQPPAVFSNPTNDPTVTNLINQYALYYQQYTQLFDGYAKQTLYNEGNYGSAPSATYQPPAAPTSAAGYYNFATGAKPATGTDYVSEYEYYFINTVLKENFGSYTGQSFQSVVATGFYCRFSGCAPIAAPFAPLAQLAATTQPGFVSPGVLSGPVTVDAVNTANALAINAIANNPLELNLSALYGIGSGIYNTTTAASLMTQAISGKGSFSYNVVAGAYFAADGSSSVSPAAVVQASPPVSVTSPTDSVTLSGHSSYSDSLISGLTINVPTLLRTGTGSINIAAAGDVLVLDKTAPGAIYTAGAAITTPSDFTATTLPAAYAINPNGLVSAPAWSTGGGSLTITAGNSIIGIESVPSYFSTSDGSGGGINLWYYHTGLSNGSVTPFLTGLNALACGGSTGVSCQTAAWVNFPTFYGFGALGGGNVSLSAGADITGVSASLPETLVVSGGLTVSDPPVAHYYGGGNLTVQAGGNINSGVFYVGRGAGFIQANGAIQADPLNPITSRSNNPGLQLAVQDGFISAISAGPAALNAVYDPAELPLSYTQTLTTVDGYTPLFDLPGSGLGGKQLEEILASNFTTYGSESGVALTALAGDVTALGYQGVGPLGKPVLLPATLDLAALAGNVTISPAGAKANYLVTYPYPTARGDGSITIVAAKSVTIFNLQMQDLVTASTAFLGDVATSYYVSPLGVPLASLTASLHANDPSPVVIAAGQNISASLQLTKPAEIEAGNNVGLDFVGQNNNVADVTSIIAGNNLGDANSYIYLYGPGTLLLEAGRNLGPFQTSGSTTTGVAGVATLGDGSTVYGNLLYGASILPPTAGLTTPRGNFPIVPYLPRQSASIDAFFGVGPSLAQAAPLGLQNAITQFVNPANAGTGGIDFLGDIASILGESRSQAWIDFQAMPALRQQLLVQRAFLDLLNQVGIDYNNPASPYHGQYGRAYTAIATLFPAAYGYTDNAASGALGAAKLVHTGQLYLAQSVFETQLGGDINIVGPGGGIILGTDATDTLQPAQEGILTLSGGSIRIFTDASMLLNQSRIFTEQGGNILLFSGNGDISAGEGPKTYFSSPVISRVCDFDGYCPINPSGLVTGAGIGALVTLPGQDPTLSSANLVTPHGKIDAGSAGIRVAGNLNVVALQVLNAYNIQVGGTAIGVPTTTTPNIGALTSANNTAAAVQAAAPPPAHHEENASTSVIIVEVIGYGGSSEPDAGLQPIPTSADESKKRREGGENP